MESITEIARACLGSFTRLTAALTEASAENCESMPPDKLEWELGRFKIWCGNLGALQSGRSSLDSRLRESTVMRTNLLKHLARLDQTLIKSTEVASGARLPLEKLLKPEDSSDDSSSEESEDGDEPRELVLHMGTIKEILSDLYMLSFRIRNSSTRPTSTLRIKLYSEVDDETGIDKFAAYTEFDKRHVEDSLLQLRRDAAKEMKRKPSEVAQITDSDQYLINRLVATMNKRRKVLRYWQRHMKKMAEMPREVEEVMKPQPMSKLQPANIERQSMMQKPGKQDQFIAPSVTEKTMLSKTEATRFDKRLDDMLEIQSVISYASTTVDVHGNDVDLPAPPTAASKGSEFLCPYCGIVCPARHGRDRAWRAHILQDLQPYICTYEKCEERDHLFSSRIAWLEHERLSHRRTWQCFEHAESKFWSKAALQHHLESEHGNDITETQIQNLVEVSELSVAETRITCPFCLLGAPFRKGFENHMAFHMQMFAAFSVSRDNLTHDNDDVDANENKSSRAEGLGSQDSRVSGPLQFDSQPPSNAASNADEQAFQSPPSSIWDEQCQSDPETQEYRITQEDPRERNQNIGLDSCSHIFDKNSAQDLSKSLPSSVSGPVNIGTLEGHSRSVSHVAFSPDGQLVASASDDETVRLWDAATGSCRSTLEGHSSWVNHVAFSPDGQLVASASGDETVRLWDAATGSCRSTLEGHSSWVSHVAFSPDGQLVASASDDETVRLWDAATGSCRSTLEGHSSSVSHVAFSPDGQLVASASDDETVRLWDAATGSCRTRSRATPTGSTT